MAIVSHFKKSDLFVTFICNLKWLKVTRKLLLNQNTANKSDLTARIFYLKLQELLKNFYEKHLLDKIIAYIYIVEFQ